MSCFESRVPTRKRQAVTKNKSNAYCLTSADSAISEGAKDMSSKPVKATERSVISLSQR